MITDYSKYKTTRAEPEASSMIETFRAIGYNTETAVADIVDNSISAGAKNIRITFEWKGEKTWIAIKDDGVGMNHDELVNALRPGSRNPLDERHSKDLGRFGLGLKTASFSQARKLTVISKKENFSTVSWTWDLDYVNQTGSWNLIDWRPSGFNMDVLDKDTSGTIVIWNNLDRIVRNSKEEDTVSEGKFYQIMESVKKHLSMVFHRFIKSRKIKIFLQEREIPAWDPFLTDESATQWFPDQPLHNDEVLIRGFVLPHKSKITEEDYKTAGGTKGWNEHQGFYIYRNERLLLAGDWLGFFKKEEHYKLARIQIDLPNTLDEEWQIDIKKSVARPPLIYREKIKQYALKLRNQAVEVYRQKGRTIQRLAGQKFIPLWEECKRNEKWYYKINRDHPIIVSAKVEANHNPDKALEKILRLIEETLPTKSIFIKESEEPEMQRKPFAGSDNELIRNMMHQMFLNLIQNGSDEQNAKGIIANTEPFNLFTEYLEFIN